MGEVMPFCLGSNSNDQADIIVVLCCVCAATESEEWATCKKKAFFIKRKGSRCAPLLLISCWCQWDDLIITQVCTSCMVEADVALNFDLHAHANTNQAGANKLAHSALPRPDNGWRVRGVKSNETGREQQLSVCVGRGEAGGGELRHKCPC